MFFFLILLISDEISLNSKCSSKRKLHTQLGGGGGSSRRWWERVISRSLGEEKLCGIWWAPPRLDRRVYIYVYTYHPASTGYRVTSSLLLLYTRHHVILHIIDVTHIVQLIQPHLSTSSLLSLSHHTGRSGNLFSFFLFSSRQKSNSAGSLFLSFSCQDFPVWLRFRRERNYVFTEHLHMSSSSSFYLFFHVLHVTGVRVSGGMVESNRANMSLCNIPGGSQTLKWKHTNDIYMYARVQHRSALVQYL